MDVKELQAYRRGLYQAVFSNTIPDRVPVQDSIGAEFMIQYAGKDLMITQYEYTEELVEEIFEKAILEVRRGDNFSAGSARNAVSLMLTQSLTTQMGSSGFLQHPEMTFMEADEYDEYIKNPFDFTIEKIYPRQNRQIAKGGAYRSMAVVARMAAEADQAAIFAKVTRKLVEKYGLHSEPAGASSGTQPPFDTIADFARGFSKIPMDMRRCPEKIMAAMDALMPQLIIRGIPRNPNVLGSCKIMTHMAAFLSNKQYDKFYFPHFKELHHILAEKGVYMCDVLEQDWTRFIDSLAEMPMGTRYYIEQGDAKQFKDKLGKNFVLAGLYPITFLRAYSKEKCIDKAKELMDIFAPGGNYYFAFDKTAQAPSDVNIENYISVMEYVKENYHYDNAGETVNTAVKREDTIIRGLADKYPAFESKYLPSWDEYKKEYPPTDPKAEKYMKAAYEKYIARLGMGTSY